MAGLDTTNFGENLNLYGRWWLLKVINLHIHNLPRGTHDSNYYMCHLVKEYNSPASVHALQLFTVNKNSKLSPFQFAK